MSSSGRWDVDRGDRAWPLEEAASGDRGSQIGRESTAGPGMKRAPNPAESQTCGTWKTRRVRAVRPGRPIARGAETLGGNRMPKKRTPVVERRQETQASWSTPPSAAWHNWPDTSPGGWARKGC
jgi:hypothetical protein